jgi:hypothetical protein
MTVLKFTGVGGLDSLNLASKCLRTLTNEEAVTTEEGITGILA